MGETTKIQKGKVSANRNSEARREQNRLASRNYREKRKQKLALLNELLEPSNLSSITGNGHIDDVPGPSGSSDTGAPPLQGQTLSSAPLTNHLIPLDLNRFDGTGTYFVPQTWEDFTQESVPTVISNQLVPEFLPVLNKGNPPSLGSHDQWEDVMPGLIQQSSAFTGQPPADYMGYRAIEEVFEDSPDSDHSGSQGASSNDDGSLKDILYGVESLSIEQKRSLLRHLQQDIRGPKSPSSSQNILHQTPGQLQAIQFAKALYKTANARPSLFPAQYTMEPGIFGAIFANCYALGMGGVDEILHDDGCTRMLFRLKSSVRISSPFSIKILMPLMKGLCAMIFFPAVSHAGELGGTHMVWVQVSGMVSCGRVLGGGIVLEGREYKYRRE
uniref:BZIP domain-containing protein n=1 Tax=Fusarium oxysporum (strain Fo5176) TaxID=660025 RepID=A0A0D2XDM1_FUSOF